MKNWKGNLENLEIKLKNWTEPLNFESILKIIYKILEKSEIKGINFESMWKAMINWLKTLEKLGRYLKIGKKYLNI